MGHPKKCSPGLQPIVNRLRRVLPGIAHVGCLSLPPPDTVDPSDIAIACAAVQVYAERKRRWPTDEDVTELSTFPLYSDRSQADAQTQVRTWYLACHMVIHSHRAARMRMPAIKRMDLPVTGPTRAQSWRSLHCYRDLFQLSHRVAVREGLEPRRKRRRLSSSRSGADSSEEVNEYACVSYF